MSPSCRTVGSPVPTVQLLSPRMGTYLGDVKSCKILRDGILGKILGDVKIPHVGSRRSSANLQGCKDVIPYPILAQAVGIVEVRDGFFGPQTAWKLLSAAAAPSFNTVLVFDHPDPNGSQAGLPVTSQ